MNDRIKQIDHTLEFLKTFKLELTSETDINDLKIIHETPAIAIIGLVSRGKSTLVNKLIGLDLLPTGPNPVTFGNGFLQSGPPRAMGLLASRRRLELPSDPEQFRHRARRHESQDIVDFEYTGNLRIPDGVMLIDTKGLDEISTSFNDDILELERSWATQGAMAALLVTSVPPGMSAQDARLFQTLNEHFNGNVTVVVKQTDSSLSDQDLREAAKVWAGHGANVITVPDGAPSSNDAWGVGPLKELEDKLSIIWSDSSRMRDFASKRLEESIGQLAKSIKTPGSQSSTTDLSLPRLWSAITDNLILSDVREVARTRLQESYTHSGSVPESRAEFERTLRYAVIGSEAALNHLRETLKKQSKLKKVIPTDELIRILSDELPLRFGEICRSLEISSHAEFLKVSRTADYLYQNGQNWIPLEEACLKYVKPIRDEGQILKLINEGGELLAPRLLPHLLLIWKNHIAIPTSRLSSFFVAKSALSEKSLANNSLSNVNKTQMMAIFKEVLEKSATWGEKEYSAYEERSHNPYVSVYSRPMDQYNNPFIALREEGERIIEVLGRLSILADSFDEELSALHHQCNSELGAESDKQLWTQRCTRLSNFNLDNKDTFTTFYGWAAVCFAVICVFTFANRAFGPAMFFGSSGLLSWALWYFSQGVDPVKIAPFSPNRIVKDLDSQIWNKLGIYAAVFVVFAIASGVISAFIPSSTETFTQEFSPPPVTIQNTPTPTVRVVPTTSPPTTAEILSMSDDDLLGDLIQDGRGNELLEIFLPSDESNRVGYAFKLSNKWFDLPDQVRTNYCWIDQDQNDVACRDTTAIRFSQVTDAVIYSILTPIPDSLATNTYKFRVEIDGIEGRFISLKSLAISQDLTENTTNTSLPYLTKRNRYWNADCPRLMQKNEFLPLKLCQEGRGVKRVQSLLGLEADGYFGNTTYNALLDFQFAQGLTPTGIVDRQTWYELDRAQGGPGMDYNGDGLVTPDEFR